MSFGELPLDRDFIAYARRRDLAGAQRHRDVRRASTARVTTLRGRTALLTGATGGLGVEMAGRLAREGVHLAVSARSEAKLGQLARTLRGYGVRCEPVPADLGDPQSVATLVERAENAVGPVDILVNNAAVEVCSGFEQLTPAEMARMVQINLTAPLDLTRSALNGMLARGRGHVVFVSSLSGFTGTAYEATYAATKGALIALSHSLRAEYAERSVAFCLVAPGSVAGQGMFARAQADGIRVPRSLRLANAQAVAHSVIRALTTDAPLTLAAPGPIRPALALGILAPRATERLYRRLGLAHLFRPAAETRGRA